MIDQAYDQEGLDNKEIYWIDFYNSYGEGGYNASLGGQFNLSGCPEEMSEMRGGRPFVVYDMDGNFVKETISQTEFAKELDITVKTINHILTGRKNSTHGYVLFYKDEFSEERLKDKIKQIADRHKSFAVFTKDWDIVGIWNNKMVCSEDIDFSRRSIQKQLNEGLSRKSPRRYRLYYLNNIPIEHKYKIKEVI